MIRVLLSAIEKKAKAMPAAYRKDCFAAGQKDGDALIFLPQDYEGIRRQYRGYAVSEADRFREGEIISGCCDRADQY